MCNLRTRLAWWHGFRPLPLVGRSPCALILLLMIPWQNSLIECLGTLFWTLWLGLTLGSGSPLWPLGVSLGLAGLVYAAHARSGAHFNPAYTLAVLIMRRISWQEAGCYLLAHSLGGFLGAGLVWLLVQDDAFFFELVPVGSASLVEVLTTELLFTFVLVLVSLFVLLSYRLRGNSFYGLAVAGTYLAALLAAWPISRGVLNPALALGANLISGSYEPIWYYFVGPLLGGSLAGLVFRLLSPDDVPPPREQVRQIRDEVLATLEGEEEDPAASVELSHREAE